MKRQRIAFCIQYQHYDKADEYECSSCGARFQERTTICPKCGIHFSGVKKDDTAFIEEMEEQEDWDEF